MLKQMRKARTTRLLARRADMSGQIHRHDRIRFVDVENHRQTVFKGEGLERQKPFGFSNGFGFDLFRFGHHHLDLIGCTAYAHSIGEGYQYRGTISRIYPDGAIRLVNVETTSNEECDIDFTDPYRIQGDWQPYEDFSYGSEKVSVELTEHGFIIDYWYVGSVYIHCPLHILQQQ